MKALVRFGARHARVLTWGSVAAVTGALLLTSTATTVDAHKAKTSPFSYNVDIFPLLRDNCGRCHVDGGPAPMSLMTYDKDGGAIAWAESIREMLLAGAMPPWYADPTGPAVRNNHALSPRELDKIITWATGGTPHGDLSIKLPDVKAKKDWAGGKPDAELPMPQAYTMATGVMQASNEVTIPTNFTETKWVKGVDLLPGQTSMVRRAYISIEGGSLLHVWEPGDDVVDPPSGAAFKIPAGAKLHLKVDYKKSWQDEQKALDDKSVIGLYFTEAPLSGKAIESVTIDGPKGEGDQSAKAFTGTLATGGRIVGLRPMLDAPYAIVEVNAVAASGKKVPLLKLRNARPEWPRRYWLVDPIELPANTKIEVKLEPGDPDIGPLGKAEAFALQIGLDVVPQ
jgi:mono/diheme cytochrome c family protein